MFLDCFDDPIHGDRFTEICDTVLNDRSQKRGGGKVVFVKTDYLNQYQPTGKEVLITHNSDLAPQVKGAAVHFGQNLHTNPGGISIPVPIGLERPGIAGSGDINDFKRNMEGMVTADNWIYVNFSDTTNPTRPKIKEYFRNHSWATVQETRIGFREFLHQIRRHLFVMAPPGNGSDCHRTWEALYCGSIPVCFNNYHNREFARMFPIVLYDNVEELTLPFLQSEYTRLQTRIKANCYYFHALKFGFWRELIEHYARAFGNG